MLYCFWWEHKDIVFECFKHISVSLNNFFFPWQDLKTRFFQIFPTYEASVWPVQISVWKPYTKHVHVLNFITDICFTKRILCFTKRGICLYQTEQNIANNEASLYVSLSLYAVLSQPCTRAIEVARHKLLLVWLYPLSETHFCCFGQCFNSSPFHMALLDGAVSQLPVELPRTLKGQNGVEFDFQSI